MSTRAGDLDPGLPYYLARTARMTPARFHRLVNEESGLLGVSGTSPDVRDLLARARADSRAADAIALFCHQVRKSIGAYAAVLGGLETLIFSAGIGEHAPVIRRRICDGLGFLGIDLSPNHNAKNAALISTPRSRVAVRVMPTNENLMVARSVVRVLGLGIDRRT
jgi:acetate kinase